MVGVGCRRRSSARSRLSWGVLVHRRLHLWRPDSTESFTLELERARESHGEVTTPALHVKKAHVHAIALSRGGHRIAVSLTASKGLHRSLRSLEPKSSDLERGFSQGVLLFFDGPVACNRLVQDSLRLQLVRGGLTLLQRVHAPKTCRASNTIAGRAEAATWAL